MMKIEINKLNDESEVELIGEVPSEHFNSFRPAAIEQLNTEVKLDGFRPGHIPEAVLITKLGEERILLTMAELALQKLYPEIIREHKIDAIGRPKITLTKLAPGNPLGYKIQTAVSPSFALPEYRAIAKEINQAREVAVDIGDEEVDRALTEIKERQKQATSNTEPEPADLREQVKGHLEREATRRAQDKQRLKLIDGILAKTEIVLPKVLIEAELDKMLAEMRAQIGQMGLKFEDYLKHLQKEEKDLRQDWQVEAVKRVKSALVLSAIAQEEKLAVPEELIEKETKHLLEHYQNTPADRARHYVADLLLIEEVWKYLENQL